MPGWFDGREAAALGVALAEGFLDGVASGRRARGGELGAGGRLEPLIRRAVQQARQLQLNFYKRARLANSFHWALLERRVQREQASTLTRQLMLGLTSAEEPPATMAAKIAEAKVGSKQLLAMANERIRQGAHAAASELLRELVRRHPRNAVALDHLGVALCHLGRYGEAKAHFRRALQLRPRCATMQTHLASVLIAQGRFEQARSLLQRALKDHPDDLRARLTLGLAALYAGRTGEAERAFALAQRRAPAHPEVLLGRGHIARIKGRFADAQALFSRALEQQPELVGAVAALPSVRRMSEADRAWLERAEALAAAVSAPLDQASLRFAIGKYHDDCGRYELAFRSVQRANELLKTLAEPYDRPARDHLVESLIGAHGRDALAASGPGSSASGRPVLVVGMMRSGTTLVEQVIASHPAVAAAGELEFWPRAMQHHRGSIEHGPLAASVRARLATGYLRELEASAPAAARVIDKMPVNSDYLGIVHSVLPNARFIYVQRDPLDTCLSCYFQQLNAGLSFKLDLNDLAHYYASHRRLLDHWRRVLPPERLLIVPYEELVADPGYWTRRMLGFLELPWDERCLAFHRSERPVATASTWQVRQPLYATSIGRWRHYEKFLRPIAHLRLEPPAERCSAAG